ncbi:hypothetical protein IWX77_000605 [Cryobacterium sp. CAN_C2]
MTVSVVSTIYYPGVNSGIRRPAASTRIKVESLTLNFQLQKLTLVWSFWNT